MKGHKWMVSESQASRAQLGFRLDKTFWGVVSAAVEQLRR